MNAIDARNIGKRYGSRVGIEGIDLKVEKGELLGFLGPNGAGKTTTIRILMGLLKADSGTANIFERDCWTESTAIKKDVGYLPGDLRLYPWMTLQRAIDLSGSLRKVDLSKPARELAERFKLEPNLLVAKMSKGTRQKLGIILALAHHPRLVILDEPTSGLDPLMQQELAKCLREMAAKGHTIFFSSHTLSEVQQLCERVVIVRSGKIVVDEPLDVLRSRAPRMVRITFASAQQASDIAVPESLRVDDRHGSTWHGVLQGSTPELIAWAAGQSLRDIEISPPDLERVFGEFYV